MNTQNQLSTEDELKIEQAIMAELVNHPPTIVVIGMSGTGKSSTINAMFNTNLAVSHVVACTKEFRDSDLKVKFSSKDTTRVSTILRVVDAPGLGEDLSRDVAYLDMYRQNLSRCDVALWILSARNRAIALEQMYLKQLKDYHENIVFGINQVDLVEPMDWNQKINLPSVRQEENIEIIMQDRKEKLESILQKEVNIAAYSAKCRYRLQDLFTMLVDAAPEHRTWIFSGIKGFSPDDFIPDSAKEKVHEMLDREEAGLKKKKSWFS